MQFRVRFLLLHSLHEGVVHDFDISIHNDVARRNVLILLREQRLQRTLRALGEHERVHEPLGQQLVLADGGVRVQQQWEAAPEGLPTEVLFVCVVQAGRVVAFQRERFVVGAVAVVALAALAVV